MPLYMARFAYAPQAWAGLVKSPENREQVVRQLLEDAGCSLRGMWYSFGPEDGFALIEAPDNVTAAGLSIAISGSGALRMFETSVLMTQGEMLDALEKASEIAYSPPAEIHV
jgi:uncharacterized protein with GYD domain